MTHDSRTQYDDYYYYYYYDYYYARHYAYLVINSERIITHIW